MKNIKKWIPFMIPASIAALGTLAAAVTGLIAFLAVTGLDLLVTAKKTAPQLAVTLCIISIVIWNIALVILFVTKPYKKTAQNDAQKN